jgi:hypothetical protein
MLIVGSQLVELAVTADPLNAETIGEPVMKSWRAKTQSPDSGASIDVS